MLKALFLSLFFIISALGYAQNDSTSFYASSSIFHKKKLTAVVSSEIVIQAGTTAMLYTLWYKDYPQSKFHLFNDNSEWLQMDKMGHAATSYQLGKYGIDLLKWSGVKGIKSIIYGGFLGLFYLTTIEVFDGFSQAWGFSTGDMLANTSGSLLLISQELLWNEQRISLKFSTHLSPYATYRPNLLGSNFQERILKDYNGQTYWLSINIASFIKTDNFPKWLNLAIGYGADGMIGGHTNPTIDANGVTIPNFTRQRQFYLSLDVDLTRVKTKSPFVNTLLGTFGFIKIPFPTIEFNQFEGVEFKAIYF